MLGLFFLGVKPWGNYAMWDGINRRKSARRADEDDDNERRFRGHEDRLYALEETVGKHAAFLGEHGPGIVKALEGIEAARGGLQVLEWIGKGVKPVIALALAYTAIKAGLLTGNWKWPY